MKKVTREPYYRSVPVTIPIRLGDASLFVDYFDHVPDCPYHFQCTFELVYVQGSSGTRIIGDTLAPFRAEGSLMLLGPLIPHTWIPCSKVSLRYPVANRVIHFTRESIGLGLLEKAEFAPVRHLLHDAETGVIFDKQTTQTVKAPLDALASLDATEQLLSFLTLLHRLATPSHYHCLEASIQDSRTLERDHTLFSKVLHHIHEHPEKAPVVDDMARRLGMSRATFSRFFRRFAKMSYIDYLNDWRVQRAATLLRDTHLPILDIALEAGFENLAHFNRQFRKRLDTTPSCYREKPGNK